MSTPCSCLSHRALDYLGGVPNPGFIHTDRVRADLGARPAEFAATLSELKRDGLVELSPSGHYVRKTGK